MFLPSVILLRRIFLRTIADTENFSTKIPWEIHGEILLVLEDRKRRSGSLSAIKDYISNSVIRSGKYFVQNSCISIFLHRVSQIAIILSFSSDLPTNLESIWKVYLGIWLGYYDGKYDRVIGKDTFLILWLYLNYLIIWDFVISRLNSWM